MPVENRYDYTSLRTVDPVLIVHVPVNKQQRNYQAQGPHRICIKHRSDIVDKVFNCADYNRNETDDERSEELCVDLFLCYLWTVDEVLVQKAPVNEDAQTDATQS